MAIIPKRKKPGTLHSFFTLKLHDQDEGRIRAEAIENALSKSGITVTIADLDVGKWGQAEIPEGKTLMTDYVFPALEQCDCSIIECSEKSVGLGVNVGYCYAIGKPVFLIAKTGSDIPVSISGLATKVIFYNKPEDLINPFRQIMKELSGYYYGVSHELQKHIEKNVFPEYQKNEPAHNLEHINYVIARSFKFAQTIPGIKYDIVYVVAAYHDIGHHIDPKTHEIESAKIMLKDNILKQFFSKEEIKTIKEAIEDHRASSDHEPRSIYGRIVSTADRNNSIESCLSRSYFYGKNLHPEYSDDELFNRAYEHLRSKFGESGYAKFFFKDEEYEKFLSEIRELLSNKENFIKTQKIYIQNLKSKKISNHIS